MKRRKLDWFLPPGTGLASFDDSYPEGRGVGGAEASVVYLTREFVKLGWDVTVYGNPPKPGYGHGVRYEAAELFEPKADRDVFILHRTPAIPEVITRVDAPVKVFFSCDQHTVGNWSNEIYPYIDKVFVISKYHQRYAFLYQNLKEKFTYITDLGVNVPDYEPTPAVKKIPGKMIFCSVSERGLPQALDFFKMLRQRIPYATLVVTSDHRLWGVDYTGVDPVLLSVAKGAEAVTYLGKISRAELVRHQLESEIMFYPCVYDENFCISAAECQMAGAVPVTTAIGALRTTVQHDVTGKLIDMPPLDPRYGERFVAEVQGLLEHREELERLRTNGIDRAKREFAWPVIASQWIEQFDTIKKEKHGK